MLSLFLDDIGKYIEPNKKPLIFKLAAFYFLL